MEIEENRPKRAPQAFTPGRVLELGKPEGYSWAKVLLPELIWIAALHRAVGSRPGTELARVLAATALEAAPGSRGWFAAASDYLLLDSGRKTAIVEQLERDRLLEQFQKGLGEIHAVFPRWPLDFLRPAKVTPINEAARREIKTWLAGLRKEDGREAIRTQATAIHLGLAAGRLSTRPNDNLSRLDDVDADPGTKHSRSVVAALSVAIPIVLVDRGKRIPPRWPEHFWSHAHRLGLADSP